MSRFAPLLVLLVCVVPVRAAQVPSSASGSSLSGTVKDETGAVMQAVTVRILDEAGRSVIQAGSTDAEGRFSIPVAPGRYRVAVSAPAFVPVEQTVTAGPDATPLDIVLRVDLIDVEVEVTPTDTLVADTSMSLTSTTLSGEDLLDLPRSEEDLADYLLQLAGADISGNLEEDILAHILVDGFEDGRLPNRDQIAQIIIDPNSMRADGQGPRIEIVTRAASGNWQGSVDFAFADESLNARTPGETQKEARQTRDMELDVRGPLIPNRLEVSAEVSSRTDERAGESLRAITPGGDIFSGVVRPEDDRQVEIGGRLQLNDRHRLDLQFNRQTRDIRNRGVGGFVLPERGSVEEDGRWRLQVSERMLRPTMTNNVRFQISRRDMRREPVRDGFAIDVADAFRSGGGTARSRTDDFSMRLDDNLRWTRGTWTFRWEGRLQYRKRRTIDESNYNGTFEFASLHDYCAATGFVGPNCAETSRLVSEALGQGTTPVYLDARGQQIPITGQPTTFTQAFGNADLTFSQTSFGTSVQADKRLGENASLGLGLQYAATNHSLDYTRFNPTVNLQYRVTPRTIVSGGVRVAFEDFNDRERLLRNDGSTYQTELVISSPSFPDPLQDGTVEIDSRTASLWVLDPDYQSPYSASPQVSLTQDLTEQLRFTVSYNPSFGSRQRRTRNVNAPFPGTPLPAAILDLPRDERQEAIDRMRPMYPYVGNVTQIETTGRSESHTTRLQIQQRRGLELFGLLLNGNLSYTYRTAADDNDFTNPYEPEWGPTRRDHEVQSRFRIRLPQRAQFASALLTSVARATYVGMNLNFNFRSNSGRLYSILAGRDLNGDQSTRDRPSGIARNTEVGPANWNLDMTLTRDFRVARGGVAAEAQAGEGRGGRGGARGSDRPRVRFQARVRNLLNRSQPRGFGSVLTSPLFGLPTGYTAGRTISLSTSFDF
jgi:hypothetical protein